MHANEHPAALSEATHVLAIQQNREIRWSYANLSITAMVRLAGSSEYSLANHPEDLLRSMTFRGIQH